MTTAELSTTRGICKSERELSLAPFSADANAPATSPALANVPEFYLLNLEAERASLFELAPDVSGGWNLLWLAEPDCESRGLDAGYISFLRHVDQSIGQLVKSAWCPVVLAGRENLLQLFRQVARYPRLLAQTIAADQSCCLSELHARALRIFTSHFQKAHQEARDRLQHTGAGEGAGCVDLSIVLPSAFFGRVESLFIARGVQLWGSYDIAEHTVHVHQERRQGDQDLIGLAATMTDLHGGNVFAVQRGEIPGNGCIAAVIRE